MPLTSKGKKVLAAMKKEYKNPKEATSIFYATMQKMKKEGKQPRWHKSK